MRVIADLQLHSKYSRAVSQKMDIKGIAHWAQLKGINLVATGDWTHPLWLKEIQANLEEDGSGLLKIKSHNKLAKNNNGPAFLLATEISSIYSQGGKLRRIHNLVWAPSLKTVEKINKALNHRGAKLMSDGRPIVGLSSIELCDLVFDIDERCLVIPAHIWTPWFSLYGSKSGFDSLEECFGKFSQYIYAIETGLSSDPAMNWRIKDLDNRTILSFSDAHSGPKLGREATVFRTKNQKSKVKNISYNDIYKLIRGDEDTDWEIAYTIEFYPEEGKYHYTGHRNCQVKYSPSETRKRGTICPVCGKKLTVGVMHRVEELAAREEDELKLANVNLGEGVKAIYSATFPHRPAYVMLVPLQEIIAETLEAGLNSKKVISEYKKLVSIFGGEFRCLLATKIDEIAQVAGAKLAEAIKRVRQGKIFVDPGYDGVFGVVKIWGKAEEENEAKEQLSLF